jgi:hypothetical protein
MRASTSTGIGTRRASASTAAVPPGERPRPRRGVCPTPAASPAAPLSSPPFAGMPAVERSGPARTLPALSDVSQLPLLGTPEPAGPVRVAAAPRVTSKGIAPGDIVEVDRKGRRFHALVERIEQRESGRFDLAVRPLDGRSTWRSATVREVVGVWRKARPAAA